MRGQSQPDRLAGPEVASALVLRAALCSPEPGALPSALSPETALERTPKTGWSEVSLGMPRVPGGEDPEFPLAVCQVGAPAAEVGDCPSEVLLSPPPELVQRAEVPSSLLLLFPKSGCTPPPTVPACRHFLRPCCIQGSQPLHVHSLTWSGMNVNELPDSRTVLSVVTRAIFLPPGN